MNRDYENGDCAAFAVAIHQLTGLPIEALIDFNEEMMSDVLVHTFVRLDSDTVLDITGQTTIDHLMRKYPHNGYPLNTRITTEEVLHLNYQKQEVIIPQDFQTAIKVLESENLLHYLKEENHSTFKSSTLE